jgi:type IV pilus assembly protein PilA
MRPVRRETRHGFTLIELLVVVVIILLLAGIALPKLQRTKNQALRVSVQSDTRQGAIALMTYATRNGGQFTGATAAAIGWVPSPGNTVTVVDVESGGAIAETANAALGLTCRVGVGTKQAVVSNLTCS